jgi:hypothetical protein
VSEDPKLGVVTAASQISSLPLDASEHGGKPMQTTLTESANQIQSESNGSRMKSSREDLRLIFAGQCKLLAARVDQGLPLVATSVQNLADCCDSLLLEEKAT